MWPYWAVRVVVSVVFAACAVGAVWALLVAPSTWTTCVVLAVWFLWRFGISRWLTELRTLSQ